MNRYLLLILVPLQCCFLMSCNGQAVQQGTAQSGNAMSKEQGQRPAKLFAIDTSAAWAEEEGQKLLVRGTVYLADGQSPAQGIIIYYYQTNAAGIYQHKPDVQRSMPPNERGQTHGYIRGWVMTDSLGRYAIYTVRPGTYPNATEPAHIHLTVTEPGRPEYYIDEIVFADDPYLTAEKKARLENRGGSGVMQLQARDGLLVGERNIYLGLNIPQGSR